jgi:hypothetical protein
MLKNHFWQLCFSYAVLFLIYSSQKNLRNMKKQVKNALFYLFLVLITLKANSIKAQNTDDTINKNKSTRYFKAYLETFYDSKETILKEASRTFINQVKVFKIYPSIAFTKINSEGLLFEMSFALQNLEYKNDISENRIDSLSIRVPTRGAETFSLALGSRFEWAWQLKNTGTNQLYLGISANPTFSFENIVPYTTASFPSYQYDLTTGISIVPRWCWQLTDKLLMDVNIPFTFTEIDLNYSYVGDPSLPEFAREKTGLKSKFVIKPQLRIGFGVRF